MYTLAATINQNDDVEKRLIDLLKTFEEATGKPFSLIRFVREAGRVVALVIK